MRHALARLADDAAARDLACSLRWVQLPMVLLTALFTALSFKVFDVWSGLPLMLAVQAPMLVAMASVWPGRSLPRSRAFALTVTAHVVAVLVGGLAVGQGPATTLPMAIGGIAYALALALAYRRHHDTWSPRDARAAVAFFGYAFALAPIGLLLGAYAGCPPTALLTDPTLALVACARAAVDTCLAIGTAVVLYFAPPAASRLVAKPLAPLLIAGTVFAPLLLVQGPSSPVAWVVVIGPVGCALIMTPRWTAAVILVMTAASAFYTFPWYAPVAVTWFPPKLFIDLLMGFTPMAACVVSVARDSNDRMAAEAASSVRVAQEQGELMSRVFQTMSDGLMLVAADGRVTMSNLAAERLLGTAIPEVVGHGAPRWPVPPPNLDAADAGEPLRPDEVAAILAAPAPDGARDLLIQAGDGPPRRVTLQHRPIHLDEDSLTLHLITDITQEYTRQRELESFAGTLAHDLKGPLAAVSGWLDAAEDELADDDATSALAAARRASSASVRMRAMIEDYLAYTVQHDGELVPTDVVLRDVVEDIAAVYEGADRAGVIFELEVPHVVRADASLTRQIIANLINNAVKYSRPGQPAYVHVTSAVDAPGWVRIGVADRGVGIQPGEEETIFGAYQRSDKDAADYQGIGLGLSLCAQIVARHGGWIKAEHNDWGGATFSFTLPAAAGGGHGSAGGPGGTVTGTVPGTPAAPISTPEASS